MLAAFLFLSSAFGDLRRCPLDAQFVVVDDARGSEGSGGASRTPTLVVRNVSTVAVIGFVVKVDFVDPKTGAVVSYRIAKVLRETPEGKRVPLPPGASVTLRRTNVPTLTGDRLADSKVTFDLVVYADGSHWGPASLLQSTELLTRAQAK